MEAAMRKQRSFPNGSATGQFDPERASKISAVKGLDEPQDHVAVALARAA
jgi:hypothetical protein